MKEILVFLKKHNLYALLIASLIFCEILIKNGQIKVAFIALINLFFTLICYPKLTKIKFLLFIVFIFIMTYLFYKVLSYPPYLGGYILLPLSLLTIHKYYKNR